MRVCVFVPQSLWRIKSGWLLGWWKESPTPIIYILAVLHSSEPSSQKLADRSVIPEGRVGFMPSVLGELINDDCGELFTNFLSSKLLKEVANFYLRLRVFNCHLMVEEVTLHRSPVDIETECIVYLYDPVPVFTSELLTVKTRKDYFKGVFVQEEFDSYSCVEKLLSVLWQWQQYQLVDVDEITDGALQTNPIRPHHHTEKQSSTGHSRVHNFIVRVQRFIFSSAFVRQLYQRTSHLQFLESSFGHKGTCLRCQNTLSSLVFDIFIGLVILWQFHEWLSTGHVFNLFMSSASSVVANLQKLICWLMGAPAGLKLNHQLNSALGHFFLYHIYLWETYITVVKPVLQYMMEMITVLGYFGVTFQLSMLNDLISLATFHIYCFYVYATRLYNLHLCGLHSLWRLARGRKWNPLRQREDSCAYGKDQLLLGALLFMILLFLLPTTLLYYVVFSSLRLVVLSIHGALNRVTTVISTAPIWTVFLWLGSANAVSGDIHFSVDADCQAGQPTTVVMKVIPSALEKVCESTAPINYTERDTTTYKQLLKDLLVGNLIYPL